MMDDGRPGNGFRDGSETALTPVWRRRGLGTVH